MDITSCDECRAIQDELKALKESARKAYEAGLAGGVTAQDVVDCLREGDEEDFARLRAASPFSQLWQRAREHRTLTGHLKFWPWLQEPPNMGASRN